jgi:TetR/AcrR family transcriptional regulator
LTGELRDVVDNLALLINHWADSGSIRAVDPYHLIFSIWAMTQHYADFEVQVKAIWGERDHFEDAEQYLEDMLRRMLTV